MSKATLSLVLLSLCCSAVEAQTSDAAYEKIQLTDKFHCEGAYYADFDRDGDLDVVAGPYWYAGPDFQQRHEVREPEEFDPNGYSDNFLTGVLQNQNRYFFERAKGVKNGWSFMAQPDHGGFCHARHCRISYGDT